MENTENTDPQKLEPTETTSKKRIFKSKKLKLIIPLAVVIIVTLIFGIVKAQKKFGDGPGGFIIGMITDKLDLSENQKAQVERIHDEIKSKMESKKGNRESMMEEFANEFKKDNMDKSKLKELDQKREQNMQETKDFVMDRIIEFHDLLTPEQRTKAVETMKEMKDKFHKHGGMDRPKDNKDREK